MARKPSLSPFHRRKVFDWALCIVHFCEATEELNHLGRAGDGPVCPWEQTSRRVEVVSAMEALNQLYEPGPLSRTILPKTPVLNDRRNGNCFSLPGRALLDKCVWYAEQRTDLTDML